MAYSLLRESSDAYDEYLEFLHRIRYLGPIDEEDDERISRFPDHVSVRPEQPIPLTPPCKQSIFEDFLRKGDLGHPVKQYASVQQGLKQEGWLEMPEKESKAATGVMGLGSGACATVHLAYMRSDRRLDLESRHLAAFKVSPDVGLPRASDISNCWREISILRGCVHRHIVAYYGHFVTGSVRFGHFAISNVVLLLEYASAGDILTEVCRYDDKRIPETGALYYAMHVAAGLQHLHSKCILHNDLHTGNVLLKYRRDGRKTAMIADFGLSLVCDPKLAFDARTDVHNLTGLCQMCVCRCCS